MTKSFFGAFPSSVFLPLWDCLFQSVKRAITVLTLLILVSCARQNETEGVANDPMIERDLQVLLANREYFKLRSDLGRYDKRISAETKQYFMAFIASAFNRYAESIGTIDSLLARKDAFLNDSARVDLMLVLRDNYFKTFRYDKAAAVGREILSNYKNVLGDRSDDVENTLLIHTALTPIPPQRVNLKKVTLQWKPNEIGLIEIPIRSGHAVLPIVFDTRAHISTVTQSFARKLGLSILNVSFEESSGITGKKFKSGLGIADSLYLGDILLHNVVFQILPDEELYFPSIKYTLHAILGFQVITQLKEIHIYKNGDFIVSPSPASSDLRNLAFDGSTTVISLKKDGDTLSFHFDTGATSSEFYSAYFNRYKEEILRHGKVETVQSGGAGGTIKVEVHTLPVVNLAIGNKKVVLTNIGVRTVPIYKSQKYYGNIGQDLIQQFDEMVLNFEDMYVDFR